MSSMLVCSYDFQMFVCSILLAARGTLPGVDSRCLSFLYKPRDPRGVQEEDAKRPAGCAGRLAGTRAESYRNRLAGTQWSHLLCSTAQGRLGSALIIPSRCAPVVNSSREAGQASAFLPSKSNIAFVSIVSPECFFCTLNQLPLFTCGHREQIILFHGSVTGVRWALMEELWDLLQWPEGVLGSALSPSWHCKKEFGGHHRPVTCPLVASAAGAEPTSGFGR